MRTFFWTLFFAFFCAACGGSGGPNSDGNSPHGGSQAPIVSLTANPQTIAANGIVTLQWTSESATRCVASDGWNGSKATSGSEVTDALTATTTFTLSCTGPGGTRNQSVFVTVNPVSSGVVFPLHVEPGKRYLVDADGKPFLIQGDSPWSLIVQLNQAEVDLYLDDRRARGFNTLLVNLIEHRFANNAPNNVYGQGPFLTPGDYSTPNEQYFAHADWVLSRAAQKGFLVLLVPSYVGYNGGNEGWYSEMVENGSTKLRNYGRYLGQRYRSFTNIVWTYGGDWNPPDSSALRAIAEGIREFDTRALGSAHCGNGTAAIEYWGAESWLNVNNVYTSGPVYSDALRQYQRPEQMPFFLIESIYENEHDVTIRQIRTQAYHALLSGAAGQVFGNHPIWHFNGPGLFPNTITWQQALGGPGSQSMSHVWEFFSSLEWWTLSPDAANATLVAGLGSGQDRAVAALSTNRSLAVAYVPTVRDVSINLGQMAGPTVSARWYDPSNGRYTTVAGSPFTASGARTFRPSGNNSAGDSDWVLLLQRVQ